MPKDAKPYAYFDEASIMETFNIKETGNELEKALRDELGSESAISLTIDVQIPELLRGDRRGFYNSIIQICTYLNKFIINLNIDIELIRVGTYVSEVRLNVDIRGSHPDRQAISAFVNSRQDHIASLLKLLPYQTKFSHGDQWLHFSFSMIFQYSAQTENIPDLFRDKKILLVEAHRLSALIFATFMEEWGCYVTKISDGFLAVEEAKRLSYHIALINIHSPEMSGIQTIRKIREFDQRTPIIGLTSLWAKDDALQASAAGANDILAKPVSSNELQKVLKKYLMNTGKTFNMFP